MSLKYLRVLGLVALLAGSPPPGTWLFRAFQRFLRLLFLVVGAAAITTLAASATDKLFDTERFRSAVARMVPEDWKDVDTELPGKLYTTVGGRRDGSSAYLLVGVRVRPQPLPPEADPCQPKKETSFTGAICLYDLAPVINNPEWRNSLEAWRPPLVPVPLGHWLLSWLDNFRQIRFPFSAYAIGAMVLEVAARQPDAEFTRTKARKIGVLVEQSMPDVFLPDSAEVVWARRLNGPIQFTIYFFGALALIMLTLGAASSLVTNSAVKAIRRLKLPDEGWRQDEATAIAEARAAAAQDAAAREEEGEDLGSATPGEEAANEPTGQSNQGDDAAAPMAQDVQEIREFNLPWHGDSAQHGFDRKDVHMTARFYEAVSRELQRRCAVLGVEVDPPVIRFRRAAARAVANTMDTSIVPSFLDAQKNNFLTYFDARWSAVRYLLWLIPTIGFIGTILGVSDALLSTLGLQSNRDFVAAGAQGQVSASMGMAFDTTLVGLVVAVFIMWIYHMIQGAEEVMTVRECNYAEEEVMHNIRASRRSDDPANILDNLATMGLSAQILIRNLDLFHEMGPRMQAALERFRLGAERLEESQRTEHRRGRSRRTTVVVVFLVAAVLLAWLALNHWF
ncbi:MAG: MotA/TolQ/ExbB proton channel family protein [Deltaproteobacteria bacterium]|nr:MotA/TolQ/ExbB proton channel family protein [Deltaproteobacteria bacterium]